MPKNMVLTLQIEKCFGILNSSLIGLCPEVDVFEGQCRHKRQIEEQNVEVSGD